MDYSLLNCIYSQGTVLDGAVPDDILQKDLHECTDLWNNQVLQICIMSWGAPNELYLLPHR